MRFEHHSDDKCPKIFHHYQNPVGDARPMTPSFNDSFLNVKLDSIFGYKFNNDGSLIRGINAFGDDFYGDNSWTWQQSEKSVNLMQDTYPFENYRYTRNRTWIPVAMDENGRIHIVEFELTAFDNNQDGVITNDELRVRFQPRLNILVIEDLSQWPGLLQYVTELLTP